MKSREDKDWNRDRESIWSVAREVKTLYFLAFIVLVVLGMGLLTWREVTQSDGVGPLEILLAIWEDSAKIVTASVGLSVVGAEIVRYVMVLARHLEERLERVRERRRAEGRVQGREEGRVQGREEANARWEAWNARREAAAAQGIPFDEPPPSDNGRPS